MILVPDGSDFDEWRQRHSFTRLLPASADVVPELYDQRRARYEQDVSKVACFVEASRVGQLVLAEVRAPVRVKPFYPRTACEVNASVSQSGNEIYFTPAFYRGGGHGTCGSHPSRADSTLLHELIHVIRKRGGFPNRAMRRWYDSEEEVFAVMVQNYYNQERGLTPRRSHHGFAPLTVTDRIWLGQSPDGRRSYRDFVERFVADHEKLAEGLAGLGVRFDPIGRVLASAAAAA